MKKNISNFCWFKGHGLHKYQNDIYEIDCYVFTS